MSQATDLLNSLSNEGTIGPSVEEHFVVGTDRFIYIPDDLRKIGVAGDKDINTVTFDCPRYWDGVDISEFTMYINYMRPDNSPSKYHATVMIDEEDESILHFDWTFSDHALEYKGTLTFLLCAKEIDENGIETRHWNSERNSDLVISEGMEVDEAIITLYPDIITQILKDISDIKENGTGGGGTSAAGIPKGGKKGQILCKQSDEDYDAVWTDFTIPEQYGLVSYDQDKALTIT